MVNHRLLQGVIPALITPLSADRSVDTATLARIVERAADAGVDGFAPCGTTGEGWDLPADARWLVLDTVAAQVRGAVPVICWVESRTVESTLRELETAADRRATMALVAPPAHVADQIEFFAALAERTPLPLVLYNIPQVSGATVGIETVRALADHVAIGGIKDSSRDFEYLQRLIWSSHTADQFSVVTGTDTLLVASMLAGAAGAIAASPGVVPRLSVEIRDAMRAGEVQRAWRTQRELADVVDVCRGNAFPAGWKAALQILGYGTARVLPPRDNPDREFVANLRDALMRVEAFARAMREE